MSVFYVPDWNLLSVLDEDKIQLLSSALAISFDQYPDLKPEKYNQILQGYADDLRTEVDAIPELPLKVAVINRHLFSELGYCGELNEYYDPRNSYINDVIERRRGNPISLSIILIDVARRLDVKLDGISFPGHFLVRLATDDGILVVDPFNGGRPLKIDELRQRAHANTQQMPDDDDLFKLLQPASPKAILMRVLRNLYGSYMGIKEFDLAARSADRVLKLFPNHSDSLRERGLAYLELGYKQGALNDFISYTKYTKDDSEIQTIRNHIVDLSRENQLNMH